MSTTTPPRRPFPPVTGTCCWVSRRHHHLKINRVSYTILRLDKRLRLINWRSGNVYDAMMTLSPDGQTLVVRGYLGFPFLGRNEYWKRVQDSAYSTLDPKIKAMLDSSAK